MFDINSINNLRKTKYRTQLKWQQQQQQQQRKDIYFTESESHFDLRQMKVFHMEIRLRYCLFIHFVIHFSLVIIFPFSFVFWISSSTYFQTILLTMNVLCVWLLL